MSMDLFTDFIRHLAIKDKGYRKLPSSVLRTTNEGTRQIYDIVRKRLGHKFDEKPATPPRVVPPTKSPSPKTKEVPATTSQVPEEPDQIQTTIVQPIITGEEKQIETKNGPPSSIRNNPPSNSSASDQDGDNECDNEGDEDLNDEHDYVKSLFCGYLDAQPNIPASFISFTMNAPYDSSFVFKAADDADNKE